MKVDGYDMTEIVEMGMYAKHQINKMRKGETRQEKKKVNESCPDSAG